MFGNTRLLPLCPETGGQPGSGTNLFIVYKNSYNYGREPPRQHACYVRAGHIWLVSPRKLQMVISGRNYMQLCKCITIVYIYVYGLLGSKPGC